MFAKIPRDRPTAFEALRIIMNLQQTLPEDVLNIPLKSMSYHLVVLVPLRS